MGDKGADFVKDAGGGIRTELQKNAHMQAFFGPRHLRKKAPRKGAMVPVVGLEPTRMISPTDFESVTSANSITPANLLRFSAFFRFLEIGGHGGGQKPNFTVFGFQKIPKLGDFRSSERQTEQDFLSPARLPIPSFRRCGELYHRAGRLARDFLRRGGAGRRSGGVSEEASQSSGEHGETGLHGSGRAP